MSKVQSEFDKCKKEFQSNKIDMMRMHQRLEDLGRELLCKRLRSRCFWKTSRTESQIYEICRWFDDSQWWSLQRLRRYCLQTRPSETGCFRNQGENYVALGS